MKAKKEKCTFNSDLHLICDKYSARNKLEYISFKNGFAYVSNAHIAIKQSLKLHNISNPEFLEGKLLHYTTFSEIRKRDFVICEPDGIACIENHSIIKYKFKDNTVDPDTSDWLSTNIDEIILKAEKEEAHIEQIAFNVRLLNLLLKAFCGDTKQSITLKFKGSDKAAIVVPNWETEHEQIGIICPCMLQDY